MSDQDLDALNRTVTPAIWKAECEPSPEAWEEVARCERALVEALPDGGERRIALRGVEEAARKAAALRAGDGLTPELEPDGGIDGTTGLPLEPVAEQLVDARDEWAVKGGRVPALAAQGREEEARFGDRVRELWRKNPDLEAAGLRLVLSDFAAAIDRDAEGLREAIFGERPEQVGAKAHPEAKRFEIAGNEGAAGLRVAINPDGEAILWPVDSSVGQGFALHPVAARDLALLLSTQLPDGPFSVTLAVDTGPWSWTRIITIVATAAGWAPERFVQEFGEDEYALERFLEAEEGGEGEKDDGELPGDYEDTPENEPTPDRREPDVKALAGAATDFLAAYDQHGAQPEKMAAEVEALKRTLR